jgi:hypothetical protein
MAEITATIVFQQIWAAIHAVTPEGKRKYRYILNKGSSRSSKTHSLIQTLYLFAIQNASKRVSVWRDTKKNCKDTVGNDMAKVYPKMPNANTVGFNKTDSVYLFANKSVIEINGTDNADILHGYNGDVIWLNEPYSMAKDTFDQLDMRATDFLLIDLNPKQSHWSEDLEKDPRCIVINSTFMDNPFCPEEQRLKILSYQPVSMSEVVMKKLLSEGDARIYALDKNPRLFTEKQLLELQRCQENERKSSAGVFNWKVYGLGLKAEKPNRIFNWTEIEDSEYHKIDTKKYWGVDWGQVDPWGILEAKYYDGALYFHEKNYSSEESIKKLMSFSEIQLVNSKDEGLVGYMFDKLQIPKNGYIICDDNRAMKVVALRTNGWDYAITATKGPGSILDGINLLSELKVYYTKSSRNLAMEQENYSWMMFKGEVTEEPEDANNHLIDPARYIAAFLRMNEIIKKI